MTTTATLTIACTIPNGLTMPVGTIEPHPTEIDPIRRELGVITLGRFLPPDTRSLTEVNASLWAAWRTANLQNSLVTSGSVYEA